MKFLLLGFIAICLNVNAQETLLVKPTESEVTKVADWGPLKAGTGLVTPEVSSCKLTGKTLELYVSFEYRLKEKPSNIHLLLTSTNHFVAFTKVESAIPGAIYRVKLTVGDEKLKNSKKDWIINYGLTVRSALEGSNSPMSDFLLCEME